MGNDFRYAWNSPESDSGNLQRQCINGATFQDLLIGFEQRRDRLLVDFHF